MADAERLWALTPAEVARCESVLAMSLPNAPVEGVYRDGRPLHVVIGRCIAIYATGDSLEPRRFRVALVLAGPRPQSYEVIQEDLGFEDAMADGAAAYARIATDMAIASTRYPRPAPSGDPVSSIRRA